VRYIVRRLLLTVPLLLSVTFLVFSMLKLIKGDPVKTILGTAYTEEAAKGLTHTLGLDRPFLVQYWKWITGIFRGDLGFSYISREPVWDIMKRGIPVSLTLICYTMFFTLIVAIPLGVYSAYRVGSRFDRFVSSMAFAFLSMPGFVVGLLGLMFIAVRFNLLPAGNYVGFFKSPVQCTRHMILPAMSLSLPLIATYLRTLRTDMVATLQEDYVTLAKTKGLSDQRILWRHAFRPSSVTLATVAGVTVGGLIGNTLIAEQLFQLPGVGKQIVVGLFTRDYLVVLGGVGLVTVVFVITTTVVDLLYGVIDPRVRRSRS
jgi:peptide/nickel transport system permease protein